MMVLINEIQINFIILLTSNIQQNLGMISLMNL